MDRPRLTDASRVLSDVLGELRGRPSTSRAERALDRQLAYQERKAAALVARRDRVEPGLFVRSRALRERLERHVPIASSTRVLEVGSGAHGHVFFFGACDPVGVDPLADAYRALFPWQDRAHTIAADGARLPIGDASFDVVISDNVIDHAGDPRGIVGELVRVLAPGGILFFTVNVHHALYDVVSRAHGALRVLGVPVEIGPFADHTVHLTHASARALVARPELDVLEERVEGPSGARPSRGRALDLAIRALTRTFPKNRVLEVVARRRA